MALIETSIQINKPAKAVFAYVTDIEGMKNEYVEKIDIEGPLRAGLKYQIHVKAGGRVIITNHEVVAFEQDKMISTKTIAAPPASDVISTYIVEESSGSTKLTLQTEAMLTVPGMPSMPGMEDMMRTQMVAGFNATLANMKKAIEG